MAIITADFAASRRRSQPFSLMRRHNEKLTPQKFDPNAVHALLLQVRRDTVGSNRTPFLQDRMGGDIAASDIDQLAAGLQHKMNHGRLFLT